MKHLKNYLQKSKLTIALAIILAFVCVANQFFGELPWLAAMCGFPWTAYGASQGFYYNKSKAENTAGGITYDTAMGEINEDARG